MTDKQRAAKVLELLAERYPDLETHLMAESPWELLVATVLAAQCTDKRVNQVTPELFRRWPDPAALAQATIPELEEVIHSVGFYHSKAKHLIAAAQLVVKEFNGETPNTMKDLIKLPGVARKTANVVLGNAFGVPGFPVDTHVIRVTGRLRWPCGADSASTRALPWTRTSSASPGASGSPSIPIPWTSKRIWSNCSRNPNGARSTTGWSGSAAMSVMRGSPCATNARWLRFAPK